MHQLSFGVGAGDTDREGLLGARAAKPAELSRLGLPVPPGLTITMAAWRHVLHHGRLPDQLPVPVPTCSRWSRSSGGSIGTMKTRSIHGGP